MPEGGTANFKVIAVDPDGNRKALPALQWSLVSVERNYQWYRSGNSWNYEPVTSTEAIADGKIDIAADGDGKISHAGRLGPLPARNRDRRPDGPATSYEFDAGWYVAATSTETPDGLEIALDKDNYAPGEVAKLKVSPRFAGELLVTVGAETLLDDRDRQRAGRRRDGRHPGRRRLGRRRLCHGDALPARRGAGNRACRRAPSASNG